MTKTKILAAAAVLSLAAGALLPQSAVAASFSLNDYLRGGQARAEAIEVASARRLDDNDADRSETSRGHDSADNDNGRDNDDGNGRDSDDGNDRDSNHDSDAGNDHDSDGGNDHDSDGGNDHDSDGGNDHDSDSD